MMIGILLLPLAAAVLVTILGYVWYGPIFGKHFMRSMGINTSPEMMEANKQANKKDMIIRVVLDFVSSFIMFFGFLTIMNLAFASTYSAALIFGIIFWFFIIMPNKASGAIWSGRARRDSWTLFGINAGYSLVSFALVAPLFILLLRFF
ncbi:hypothetical protein A3C57_00475 [Candidatus Nomurabacteria bacterium RIFCSPHIGHO2_02_FULL_33_12]|nr:MAG: hypothetical protein A3C57_00475 [Candidatus Nomurabacteria bacterium RIFCSPHIGHO2_02_FULL_33_12]